MTHMNDAEVRARRQWPMTILLLLEAAVIGSYAVGFLSVRWTLVAFFVLLIPCGTFLAFTRWRQS